MIDIHGGVHGGNEHLYFGTNKPPAPKPAPTPAPPAPKPVAAPAPKPAAAPAPKPVAAPAPPAKKLMLQNLATGQVIGYVTPVNYLI